MPPPRDALDEALNGGSWGVLVRHAERPLIPAGEFGGDLPITDAGRAAAESLGESVAYRLRRVVTSPIPRCVQTAEAIRRGAGASVGIEHDRRLGAPGVWIEDGATAGALFLEQGTRSVVSRQIAGEQLPGMRALADGVARLLELVFRADEAEDGVVLHVTHDAVMAPALAYLHELQSLDDVMPRFLESAAFHLRSPAHTCAWRDRRCRVRDRHARLQP